MNNDYKPTTQFEQFVVDELRHINKHLEDVEGTISNLNNFANRVRGQASILGLLFGLLGAWLNPFKKWIPPLH